MKDDMALVFLSTIDRPRKPSEIVREWGMPRERQNGLEKAAEQARKIGFLHVSNVPFFEAQFAQPWQEALRGDIAHQVDIDTDDEYGGVMQVLYHSAPKLTDLLRQDFMQEQVFDLDSVKTYYGGRPGVAAEYPWAPFRALVSASVIWTQKQEVAQGIGALEDLPGGDALQGMLGKFMNAASGMQEKALRDGFEQDPAMNGDVFKENVLLAFNENSENPALSAWVDDAVVPMIQARMGALSKFQGGGDGNG